MAPLFTHAAIARYADTMAECASSAARDLRQEQLVDITREMTRITMRIAGKALFDVDVLDEADELGKALTFAMRWVDAQTGSLPWAVRLRVASVLEARAAELPGPLAGWSRAFARALVEPIRWPNGDSRRLGEALATIERRVERMIAERRAAGLARPDLLSFLLSAQDERGSGMTDKQVRDEIVTLFLAGHETTATALAWSLYLLGKHPEAHARARAEARRLGGRAPRADDLPRLEYCLQVFKEAMRLYPPIYLFGREAATDVEIGGIGLPRGTIVLVSAHALHHRRELFPEPERFDPSRFEARAEQSRHRLSYLPFGAGPRTCIGGHFALMEGPIVLATILGRVDLELAKPTPVEPEPSATLRPKGGVPMRVTAVANRGGG
jgi:cytochrome P450